MGPCGPGLRHRSRRGGLSPSSSATSDGAAGCPRVGTFPTAAGEKKKKSETDRGRVPGRQALRVIVPRQPPSPSAHRFFRYIGKLIKVVQEEEGAAVFYLPFYIYPLPLIRQHLSSEAKRYRGDLWL